MDFNKTIETEVCVLGGGPAGSTIARRLASLGHEVLLVERDAFPRPHVGEALAPGILPLLEWLEVRDRIEQGGFIRPRRAVIHWTGDEPVIRQSGSLLVDRGRFDQLLLDSAIEVGVRVLQPARAKGAVRESPKQWHIGFEGPSGTGGIRATFLVEATGRSSALGRRRKRVSPPMIALCGYWREAPLSRTEVWIEAGRNEWFWGAPLPDGSVSAMVFIDPSRCAAGEKPLPALYRSLIDQSSLLRGSLDGFLSRPVEARDASSYLHHTPVEEDLLFVGEAAFSIDPLASQGVQAAMRCALQAALVAHTILTAPRNAALAKRFYCDRLAETTSFHQEVAAKHYREQETFSANPFWRRRATPSAKLSKQNEGAAHGAEPLTPNCRLRLSPLLALARLPVAREEIIVEIAALHHPALERPIAFLGGVELAPLLSVFGDGCSVADIMTRWTHYVDLQTASAILCWLWERKIIIAIGAVAESPFAFLQSLVVLGE